MNILMLCAFPEAPKENGKSLHEVGEASLVRDALSALLRAVETRRDTLSAVAHSAKRPPASPRVDSVEIARRAIPAQRYRLVEDDPAEAHRVGPFDLAVMIGGGDRELALGLLLRDAGVRVYPVVSTGGAAERIAAGPDETARLGLTGAQVAFLRDELIYPELFEEIFAWHAAAAPTAPSR